jgi:sec-independent protein translocase protein TatA
MGISIWQIVLVLVIILILFGAGKIPRVMGDVAKGIKSFKAGMKEGENEEIEASAEEVVSSKKAKRTKASASKKKKS